MADERREQLVQIIGRATFGGGLDVHLSKWELAAVQSAAAAILALDPAAQPSAALGEALEVLSFYADPKNWWTPNNDSFGYHNTNLEGSMERMNSKIGTLRNGNFQPDCGSRAAQVYAKYAKETT